MALGMFATLTDVEVFTQFLAADRAVEEVREEVARRRKAGECVDDLEDSPETRRKRALLSALTAELCRRVRQHARTVSRLKRQSPLDRSALDRAKRQEDTLWKLVHGFGATAISAFLKAKYLEKVKCDPQFVDDKANRTMAKIWVRIVVGKYASDGTSLRGFARLVADQIVVGDQRYWGTDGRSQDRTEPLADRDFDDAKAVDPLAELERRELVAQVQLAVSQLKERDADLVNGHKIEGLSLKDIAEQTSLTEGAVRGRFGRALTALGKTLRRMHGYLFGFLA